MVLKTIPLILCMNFEPNPSRVQEIECRNLFLKKLGHVVTLKIESRSPNPSINSRDRVQTSVHFWPIIWLFWALLPWKLGQGHQNLIKSSSCPSVIAMEICFKSIHSFMRYFADKKLSRQCWRWLTLGSAQKAVCPPPFGGGDKKKILSSSTLKVGLQNFNKGLP